jgi:ribonuclease HI
MDQAARIITEITGCTPDQTQAVISALIENGWSPPAETSQQTPPAADCVAPSALHDLPAGTILSAHTDGACSGNPGPGGWSVVFSIGGAVVGEFNGREEDTTNNRMELIAVREAIKRAPLQTTVKIVTDSKNVIGWLAGGWKRKNADIAALCQEIDGLRAERAEENGGEVIFEHVRGHNGDRLNERADELATGAITRV